jgi:hypothetical protein
MAEMEEQHSHYLTCEEELPYIRVMDLDYLVIVWDKEVELKL